MKHTAVWSAVTVVLAACATSPPATRATPTTPATSGPPPVTAASTTENVEPRTDSYAARIRALIRSNIVHASDIEGNPVAEVLVTLAPDGLVLEVSLTKSSGVRSWDDAVVRAIHRTQRVPPDPTGKVPSQLVVTFRPR